MFRPVVSGCLHDADFDKPEPLMQRYAAKVRAQDLTHNFLNEWKFGKCIAEAIIPESTACASRETFRSQIKSPFATLPRLINVSKVHQRNWNTVKK